MEGERPFLRLRTVRKWESLAAELGVSEVARGPSGFVAAYKRAGGDPRRLSERWRIMRRGFIARHEAQMKANQEPLWQGGKPTRRHLALIMWAYSPNPRLLN